MIVTPELECAFWHYADFDGIPISTFMTEGRADNISNDELRHLAHQRNFTELLFAHIPRSHPIVRAFISWALLKDDAIAMPSDYKVDICGFQGVFPIISPYGIKLDIMQFSFSYDAFTFDYDGPPALFTNPIDNAITRGGYIQ